MKRFILYGAMALGLLSTSCSDEHDDVGQVADSERTYYVNISISADGPGGSRASGTDGNPVAGEPDFANGTGAESQINTAHLVFYDFNGNPVGNAKPIAITPQTTLTNDPTTVEKFFQNVVQVTVEEGEGIPTQVVCYLNAVSIDDLNNKPLSEIQDQMRGRLSKTTTVEGADGTTTASTGFSMSNSVYYPGTASPLIAVSIPTTSLHKTQKEAENALIAGKNIVEIFVERYAAKVTFSTIAQADVPAYVTATSLINNESYTPIELNFNYKKWVVNAQCTQTYIVKSYRQEGGDGLYNFTTLNDIINGALTDAPATNWIWNNAAYHRSYWGMSPAYFTTEYPEVSSDVQVINGTNNKLAQHYYSYDELNGTTGNSSGVGNSVVPNGSSSYVFETTVGSRALATKNPNAAVASVVLTGEYQLKIGGTFNTSTDPETGKETVTVSGGTEVPVGTTFYTYITGGPANNPLVFFKAKASGDGSEVGASEIEGGESMIRRFLEQVELYKQVTNADGSQEFVQYSTADKDDIETLVSVLSVDSISDDIRAELTTKVPERYRTLQFKTTLNGTQQADLANIYLSNPDGGYSQVSASTTPTSEQISIQDANRALMEQVGFCNMYNTGKAYFNIPVRHLGWWRTGNVNAVEGATLNWKAVHVGDFGIVRNHAYTIDVSNIVGLATGIGGTTNPIVPPPPSQDYFIAYKVNILQWAIVPTQSVVL